MSDDPQSSDSNSTTGPSAQPTASPPPPRLALPPIPTEEERRILDVTEGNKVALDELGPMIINSDGTVSRISNWAHMNQIERERTVRLLVRKRNVERLNKLKEDGERGAGEGAGEGDAAGEAGRVA